jgi:outer membrane protein
MNTFLKSVLFGLMFTIGFTAQAQKFGYVNSQELITELPAVKEANAEIETLKTQMQKKGQNMVAALENKVKTLQAQEAQGQLSRVQIETESAALQAEQQKIAEFEQTSQQQIYKKSEELLAPIQAKIQTAIDEVAAEQGYTYIFDASLGILLYADPANDITPLVKTKLGM